MKKVLYLAILSLMSLSIFGQSYSLKSTIGGVGAIGEQITSSAYNYYASGESIYFLHPRTSKMIIEVDFQGIIKNKYTFPYFSKALGNSTFEDIFDFCVDKQNRFIIYSDKNYQLFCFDKNGTMVYKIDNIKAYINGGYFVCFAVDSKNNVYLGAQELITVFDTNGKFVKTIGKKGTANGEFTGTISQLFVDANDNLFVDNNSIIQQFDAKGNFVNKFAYNYEGKIAMDSSGYFYGTPDYEKVERFDKTGKVLSSIKFGGYINSNYESVLDIIAVSNNKLVEYSQSHYNTFTLDGKNKTRFNKNEYDDGALYYLNDFNFDEKGNVWIVDNNKLQQFDGNAKFLQKRTKNIDYVKPIVSVRSSGDMVYYNRSSRTLNAYRTATNLSTELMSFKNTQTLNYINLDSTDKEITVLWKAFSGSDSINVYDFSGKIKRVIMATADIEAMVKDAQANNYILTVSSSDQYKFSLSIVDKTGKLMNTFKLNVGEFGTDVVGMVIDEYGVIHIAIRDVYGGKGFAIYAFNKQGQLLTSKTNLADNAGNFSNGSSYLLKYYKGTLYLADYISGQVFVLTYMPDVKTLKETLIIQNYITKTITDTDFSLTPSSNSPASFVYSLVSGDAISLTADGKVKVLKSGVAKVKISQAATTEYAASELTIAITINLLTPTITAIQPFAKKMGDADFSIKPVSTSDGAFSYSISSGDAVSVSATGVVKVLKAGKATILITQASSAKYESTTTTVDVTVTKLSQTISFAKLPSEIYHNALPLTLNASASSNLPVTFKVLSGPASIVGGLLKLTGSTGLITVEASQLGNDQYEAATALSQSISVLLLLATEDELAKEVLLYPNPSHDYVYLRTNKVFTNYEIVNAQGITVIQRTVLSDNKIALQSLRAGLYFIKLSTKQGENTFLKFAVN